MRTMKYDMVQMVDPRLPCIDRLESDAAGASGGQMMAGMPCRSSGKTGCTVPWETPRRLKESAIFVMQIAGLSLKRDTHGFRHALAVCCPFDPIRAVCRCRPVARQAE